jgi:Holliday junction resolvase RusA-like endonuclease
MRQVIQIPDWLPPTVNQLTRGKLRHRIRLGKACRNMVAVYAYAAGVTPAEGKRRVTIRLFLGPQRKGADSDGYWKAILDSLVSARVLRDDSRHWCELAPVEFVEHSAADATTIIVEDI